MAEIMHGLVSGRPFRSLTWTSLSKSSTAMVEAVRIQEKLLAI